VTRGHTRKGDLDLRVTELERRVKRILNAFPISGSGTPAATVTDETTWGIAPSVGVSTNYAREDHTHGTPADPGSGDWLEFPIDEEPASPNAMDDEFPGAALDAKWSWLNQGPATATVADGRLKMESATAGTFSQRILYQSFVGGGVCEFWTKLFLRSRRRDANVVSAGIIAMNSVNGHGLSLHDHYSGDTRRSIYSLRSSAPATLVGIQARNEWMVPLYMGVRSDGTDISLLWSRDGSDEVTEITEPLATHLAGFDRIGLFINAEGAWSVSASFEWFRRYA
jgi:hypothetical protein